MTNIIEIEQLANEIKPGLRLLGIDLGSKTIGLATSDVSNTIATPLKTLKRGKFGVNAQELQDIIDAEQIYAIVMGLPLNMDGTEGPRCQATRAFVRNLAQKEIGPVILQDERGSTMAVTNTLIEADVSRGKRKEVVDKMAASFILQGALDRLKTLKA